MNGSYNSERPAHSAAGGRADGVAVATKMNAAGQWRARPEVLLLFALYARKCLKPSVKKRGRSLRAPISTGI